jgi:hypothetical protein
MKCHNETPCIANLDKQKMSFFSKTENKKAKQVLFRGLPVGGRGYKGVGG